MELYTIVYFMDYGKNFGGACKTLLCQISLMKKMRHRVIVFFSDYYGMGLVREYQEVCLRLGIQYEWGTYHMSSQPEDIDLVCIDRYYEVLRDKIASFKPDILHSVQINPCVELIGRELNIPHIMDIFQVSKDFFMIKYLDIFPHYHICDSEYYARQWNKYLKTDSVCIRTVAKGIDTVRRKISRNIRFVCVGSICERKNQLSVIKAFHKAIEYGIDGELALCGYADGEYYEKCRKYVEDNELENKIKFKGFCVDMRTEYEENDILICGSTCESYPNAVSEAMACGLIIISTPVAGVPEVIKDGENGYLTKDYSMSGICEKIIQALEDISDGHIYEILDNARDTYRENHSQQAVSGQLMNYYQHVVSDYKDWTRNKDTNTGLTLLRSMFQEILKRFYKYEYEFTYPKRIASKLWYLQYIFDAINVQWQQGKKFYIWGTGKYGIVVKELVEVFLPQITISGFLDSYKSGNFCDYNIFSPEHIIFQDNTIIFIAAVSGQGEIIRKMESSNRRLNKDYFILSARAW